MKRLCWLAIVVLSFLPGRGSAALPQEDELERPETSSGCSPYEHPRGGLPKWVRGGQVQRFEEIPHTAVRPEHVDPRLLHVEWNVPEERPMYWLQLSGRVSFLGPGGAPDRPMDWFEGVRVLIAREPWRSPDWWLGTDEEDTFQYDLPIRADGTFCFLFDAGELRRVVGHSATFQVGLGFAEARGSEIFWREKIPALPQSVTQLELPGAPVITETIRLINGTPSPHGFLYDPLALVRAANHLRALGEGKAMAALREYAELSWRGESREWINYTSRQGPRFPVLVEENIPFYGILEQWGNSSYSQQPELHLDWYEEHGLFLDVQLCPAGDPLAVADRLAGDPDLPRPGGYIDHRVRQQGARMLPDDPRIARELEAVLGSEGWIAPGCWERLVEAVAELGVRWDAESQSYVLGP